MPIVSNMSRTTRAIFHGVIVSYVVEERYRYSVHWVIVEHSMAGGLVDSIAPNLGTASAKRCQTHSQLSFVNKALDIGCCGTTAAYGILNLLHFIGWACQLFMFCKEDTFNMSPMLTTKVPGIGSAQIHSPAWFFTCKQEVTCLAGFRIWTFNTSL